MLIITVQDSSDAVTLQCQGRIVRGEETAVLCAAVRRYGREVILDLKMVDALDAAGIGALISLQAAGVYLKLMDPNEHVREILKLSGLNSVFEICQSETTDQRMQPNATQNPGWWNCRNQVAGSA